MAKDPNAKYYDRTGGYPVNKVIISKDEDGHPVVRAFISDLDGDVFEATWTADGMNVNTEEINYLELNSQILADMARLSRKAEKTLDQIDALLTEAGYYDSHTAELPDLSSIITQPRPKDNQGNYLPIGTNEDKLKTLRANIAASMGSKTTETSSYVSRTIAEHPGQNLLISVETRAEAVQAKALLVANGLSVKVLDELQGPADSRKKTALAAEFRAADDGTMAILRIKQASPETEEEMECDEFSVIRNMKTGTETFDFRP